MKQGGEKTKKLERGGWTTGDRGLCGNIYLPLCFYFHRFLTCFSSFPFLSSILFQLQQS